MSRSLLTDATFVIQDAHSTLERASILIENGDILAVGSRHDLRTSDEPCKEIDCRGLILMPGLINAHTHLFQVLTRGAGKSWRVRQWAEKVTYPVARQLTPEEYYFAALLACADAVRNGCTALVDHATHYARFHADQSCRAIEATGLRGVVARGGADRSLVDPGETRKLAEDLAEIKRFVDRWCGSKRVQGWVGPSGFHTCTPEALSCYKQLANDLGTRFHMHLAESAEGHREAQEAGFRNEACWAHALGLLDQQTSLAHGIWLDPEEIDLLAGTGAQIVHCPTSNQIVGSGVAPIPLMVEKHIPIALASDGASSNDSLDMIAEMKSAALIHRGVSREATIIGAKEVFEAATLGGARVLGSPKLGRLDAGYVADVVGLQLAGNPSLTPCLDPLSAVVFYASGRDVVLNMVGGKILFWRGSFPTIDLDETIGRVNEAALRHRAPNSG